MTRISIALIIGLGLIACRATGTDEVGRHNDGARNAAVETSAPSGGSMVLAATSDVGTMTGPSQNESSLSNLKNTLALSEEARDFVLRASNGLTFMVETSRLALQKRISVEHRDFAQTASGEYGSALERLAGIVRNKDGTLVSGMTRDQYNDLADLRKLDGADFDRRFHALQVREHDAALALFGRASEVQADQDLRTFAKDIFPVVEQKRLYLDQHPH